jgi:hypothetical protein
MIDWSLAKILGVVSLLQIWWVAVWGVCYMGIDYATKHTVLTEFWIYVAMLLAVYVYLFTNPELVKYIASM